MSGSSTIEWTQHTWNPIVGCSIVSPGCTNCYAMRMAARIEAMGNAPHYEGLTKKVTGNAVWTGKLALAPDATLTEPLRRKKPTMYFVNSMGDLFHEDCLDEWIDRVFAVMALCPQHTFQCLTKRAERMRSYLSDPGCDLPDRSAGGGPRMGTVGRIKLEMLMRDRDRAPTVGFRWPLPNVWLGISCERQEEADERIPLLLQTPAAVRFISAEPLLGAIDLACKACGSTSDAHAISCPTGNSSLVHRLDWVILGGESGPHSRPMHVEWADGIHDQCRAAGVACFIKQLGSVPLSDGYPLHLNSAKGGDPSEWPMRLRVREFPNAAKATEAA